MMEGEEMETGGEVKAATSKELSDRKKERTLKIESEKDKELHVHAEYFRAEALENSIVALQLPKHLMVVHKDKASSDLQKLFQD